MHNLPGYAGCLTQSNIHLQEQTRATTYHAILVTAPAQQVLLKAIRERLQESNQILHFGVTEI